MLKQLLVGIGGGMVVGFAGIWLVLALGGGGPIARVMGGVGIADVLALYLALLTSITVHELGHLVGGRLGGARFLMFVVAPLRIVRTTKGLEASLVFNLGAIGGFAASMPDPERPLIRQLVPLIAGGPIASLALAFGAALLAPALSGRAEVWCGVLAAISALLFLVSAIPTRIGGMWSDGRQLLDIARGGRGVEQRCLVTQLYMENHAGVRPRDVDPRRLAQALDEVPGDILFDIGTFAHAYAAALDAGRIDEAGRWLDRIEDVFERYPMGFRQALALELAYFEAAHRGNAERARAWLAHARGGITEPSRVALADAALALVERRDGDARAALARCRAALRAPTSPGTAAMTADQVSALEAKLATAAA